MNFDITFVSKFKCRVWNTLNLLICSISNSTRFSNAQFFSSYRLNNAFYVEIWCYDEVIVWNILVVKVTDQNSRCYYFYHFYSVSFTVWARVRGPPKSMLLERSNSEYQCQDYLRSWKWLNLKSSSRKKIGVNFNSFSFVLV